MGTSDAAIWLMTASRTLHLEMQMVFRQQLLGGPSALIDSRQLGYA